MILNVRDDRPINPRWNLSVPALPQLLEDIQKRLCHSAAARALFYDIVKPSVRLDASLADTPDDVVLKFVTDAFPVHWVLHQLKPLVLGECEGANEISLSGDLIDAWIEGAECGKTIELEMLITATVLHQLGHALLMSSRWSPISPGASDKCILRLEDAETDSSSCSHCNSIVQRWLTGQLGTSWQSSNATGFKKLSGLYLESERNGIMQDLVFSSDQLSQILHNLPELDKARCTLLPHGLVRRRLTCSCKGQEMAETSWADAIQRHLSSMTPPSLIYHYSSDVAYDDGE